MEKAITPLGEGVSLGGERDGISFPAAVRALLRGGISWWPTESHHGVRKWRFCAFATSCSIHPAWFCILAWNPKANFLFSFFSDTWKNTTAFSGNDILSYASFLENTSLWASASVILVSLSAQGFTCFVVFCFSLAKFCFYEAVCMHKERSGNTWSHFVSFSSSTNAKSTQAALGVKDDSEVCIFQGKVWQFDLSCDREVSEEGA